MKEIKCDNCGKVIIKLAKGSQIKPDIYSMHEQCPVMDVNPLKNDKTVKDLMDIFGMKV